MAKRTQPRSQKKSLRYEDLTPKDHETIERFVKEWNKEFEPERLAIEESMRRGDGPSPYMNTRDTDLAKP